MKNRSVGEGDREVLTAGITVGVLALLLVLASLLVRLGTSIYLPALPLFETELQASKTQLSLIFSVYLAIFAACMLLTGPAADAFGRRNIILSGMLLYLAGSLVCALAGSVEGILLGRILQAVGASAVPVASQAMVLDRCSNRQAVVVVGWMGVFAGFGPIVAPVLGGALTQWFGWRSNFWFLTGCSIAIGVVLWRNMPETLLPERRTPMQPSSVMTTYRDMLASPRFVLVLAPLMVCFAAQGAYMTASPFILIGQWHLSPTVFGLTNLLMVAGLAVGRWLCIALLDRTTVSRGYLLGGVLTLCGGAGFFALASMSNLTLSGFLMTATVFASGFGVLLPIGSKAVMDGWRHRAGAATALSGCLNLAAGALAAFLFGRQADLTGDVTASLSTIMLLCALLVCFLAFIARKHLPQDFVRATPPSDDST